MQTLAGKLLALTLALYLGALEISVAEARAKNAPHDTLTAFRSDRQLTRYLKRARKPVPPPAPAPPPPAMADGASASAPAEAAAPTAGESITNTQEANVDEGGIVKTHGDTLVILRRGRLFTVSTRSGDLRPIDSIEAYPPGVNPSGDWYDEMLVAGDRVIVIGYSYGRGGTEINRFHIDNEGNLDFEDAYHLRSNDYYSSRNYASRLIGNRLIVYSPLDLPYGDYNIFDHLPALRRWDARYEHDSKSGFRRIVSAREIYLPEQWQDPYESNIETLHTVTSCDLAAAVLNCRAQTVLGPHSRTFYVSSNAVYVWLGQTRFSREELGRTPSAMIYRLPLDGSAPSAIGARGMPVDQFSFREDWDDGVLNVLVRSESGGDAMWNPEFSSGSVALLRVPLRAFGDGTGEAKHANYRRLPTPQGIGYAFQNRFVGDHVLYGLGTSWGPPRDGTATLVVASVRGDEVSELSVKHNIDRIEAMGRDAVAIGADSSDLHFQAVELTAGPAPVLGDRYTLERASQGETRSQGFFFKPDPRLGVRDLGAGTLALPVARAARPGHSQLIETSAAITFLRRADRRFSPLGELFAQDDRVVDDGCKASCADWYGNARPIFYAGRTLALMGYEIVEGEVSGDRIREIRRVNFAPAAR